MSDLPGRRLAEAGGSGVDALGVVVPAKNEEAGIAAALTAVLASLDRARRARPGLPVRAVCVTDGSTDRTDEIVRGIAACRPELELLHDPLGAVSTVGAARAAGCAALLAWHAGERGADAPRDAAAPGFADPSRLWIATTDADSLVPADWIAAHLEAAESGVDALVGTVAPDPEGTRPDVLDAWHVRHRLEEGHPYVFGANLGVRGSAYRAAGGFEPLGHGEDVSLVAALRASGARVRSTDAGRVLTSGRLQGRVAEGFSSYLRGLGDA